MPVVVACLVPSAPALLPRLTGDRVPEVGPVRRAVAQALTALTGLDRVVVVAPDVPGTLAGFGGRAVRSSPVVPARFAGSWPHALAAELLDATPGVPAARAWRSWDEVGRPDEVGGPDEEAPGRSGLLLLADGSRTRGARAPGGDDPRGARVDAELVAALRDGRAAHVPDAVAVGATAGPAVDLLARVPRGGWTAVELLHTDAPLGVCYLVAVRRAAGAAGTAGPAGVSG